MFPINGDRCPNSYLRHFIVDIIASIPINLGETCKKISWEVSLCKGVLGFRDSPFSWCMARPLRESSTRMKASSLPSFYPLCFPCSELASCANEPIESRDTNSSEERRESTRLWQIAMRCKCSLWYVFDFERSCRELSDCTAYMRWRSLDAHKKRILLFRAESAL